MQPTKKKVDNRNKAINSKKDTMMYFRKKYYKLTLW